MLNKKLIICFSLDVYLEEKLPEVLPEPGQITLELECDNFTFLPPTGTYCCFEGLEDSSSNIVVEKYGLLLESVDKFTIDVVLRDKNIRKGYIPEFSAEDIKRAIESGWTTC